MNLVRTALVAACTLFVLGCDAAYVGKAPVLVVFPDGLVENGNWQVVAQNMSEDNVVCQTKGEGGCIPCVFLELRIAGRRKAKTGPAVDCSTLSIVLESNGRSYSLKPAAYRCDSKGTVHILRLTVRDLVSRDIEGSKCIKASGARDGSSQE